MFLHYTRNREAHAFAETLAGWAARYPRLHHFIVCEHGEATDGGRAHAFGRPAISHLQHSLPANLDCDVYFLGPKLFMAFVRRNLAALGLPGHRAYYEFFGPAEALD
jgi:nitric oxide dioxygenase